MSTINNDNFDWDKYFKGELFEGKIEIKLLWKHYNEIGKFQVIYSFEENEVLINSFDNYYEAKFFYLSLKENKEIKELELKIL